MAREAIVEKVNRELAKGITSEVQVVYIMIAIRKLLERDKKKETYRALNFYCNWVGHAQLEKSAIAHEVVAAFDRAAQFQAQTASVPAGQTIPNLDWTLLDNLDETIELANFFSDMKAFAQAYGISGPLLVDQAEWITFLGHFAGVIEDCPLVYRDSSLKFVNEVVVKKISPPGYPLRLEDGSTIVFELRWESVSAGTSSRQVRQKLFSYRAAA